MTKRESLSLRMHIVKIMNIKQSTINNMYNNEIKIYQKWTKNRVEFQGWTCSGESKFCNSFSIKFAIAVMYPSRWYQEGITVCCMFTRYSSSLEKKNQLSFQIISLIISLYYNNKVTGWYHPSPEYTLQESKAWTTGWYWELRIKWKHNKLCNSISLNLQDE